MPLPSQTGDELTEPIEPKRRPPQPRLTETMFAPRRLPLLAGLLCSAAAGAQMHHVDAPEKVTRAVGVYEWTGELAKPEAARFVPISLYIDRHFEDAGLYLARPVPFALQTGDLYTVQRAGEPLGTLDLESAARVVTGNALAADNPTGAWYAYGKYTADKPPAAPPALHRTAHPGTIQSSSGAKADASDTQDDGKPHMARRAPAADDSKTTTPPDTPSSTTPHRSSSSDDDTDRPTLARRNPADDTARRRMTGGKNDQAGVTAVGPAPGDDPDRPTLTHNTAGEKAIEELTGLPAGMHQAVAVSDAASHDPHNFSRPWEDAAERTAVLAEMEKAATPGVLAYMQRNQLVPSAAPLPATPAAVTSNEGIAANTETGAGAPPRLQRGRPVEYAGSAPTTPPPPAHKPPAAHPAKPTSTKAAKPAELHLADPQLAGFTLSYDGLPTFVYTATASAQAAAGGPPLAVDVALVAQRLPSGQLQIALQSVTDSTHLDRTPRLRLVDAVDADGSHRASLLFELRGATSRQFALYRLVTAHADNTFTSAALE